MKFFLLAVLLVGCNIMAATAQSDKIVDNRAIDTLDLKKYVGLWYEIARFDHPFERGLVGVTTEYTIKPDGSIEVIGRGYQDSLRGEKKRSWVTCIPGHDTTGRSKSHLFLDLQHGLSHSGSRERLQRGSHRKFPMRSSLDREPHAETPIQEIGRLDATGAAKRVRHHRSHLRPARAGTNSGRVD